MNPPSSVLPRLLVPRLENLAFADLLAWRGGRDRCTDLFYWRTASGQEVDFVIECGAKLLPIEIKTTARPGYGEANHLRAFRQEYPRAAGGALLLHTGDETFWLSEGILATPWWRVF